MKHLLLIFIVFALFILHQDFWFWRTATPIVFGFLPIGLFYHVCYTIVVSLLMWLLVKYAWPSHLEERAEEGESEGVGERGSGRVGEWESGRVGERVSEKVGGNFLVSRSPAPPLSRSSRKEGCE
jgi:hypothetical protein